MLYRVPRAVPSVTLRRPTERGGACRHPGKPVVNQLLGFCLQPGLPHVNVPFWRFLPVAEIDSGTCRFRKNGLKNIPNLPFRTLHILNSLGGRRRVAGRPSP